MMGFDPGIGLVAMVACGVFAVLLLAAVVYLVARAFGPGRRGAQGDSARETLDRRLALGEISPEEYYERDAILRSANSAPANRARGRPA